MKRKSELLVLLGALVGGVVGYVLFFAFVRRGYYGLVLPGGALGLGAGFFRTRSKAVAIVCGLLALGLGLFTEWRFTWRATEAGLGYFLLHVHELPRMTLVMIGAGALIGFWVPFRRGQELEKG